MNLLLSESSEKTDPSETTSDITDDDERDLYNHIHADDSDVTSGYTTISSDEEGIELFNSSARNDRLVEETKHPDSKNADNPKNSSKKSNVPSHGQKEVAIGKSSRSKTLSFLDANSLAA